MDLNRDTFIGPSFPIRDRLARAIWNFIQATAFRWSPRPLHTWRSLLLRLFGAKVGRGAHIYPGVRIWAPWNLEIGEQTGVADGVILYSQAKISIGRRTVISQGTHLCTGSHDYKKIGFPLFTAPISIGDHVWVAAEVFVHPGVEIGDGAVIGARAVVVKSMPPWMVCVGYPCEPLRERERITP